MTTWFSGDVQTNGIRIHYYRTGGESGSGKPQVVLAHGATDDGLCWTRVARALELDYDVIMPDARGHGLSDAPKEGYSSVDHAADLAGLIVGLGLQQPAVGGHSMGAGSTLRLVAEHPALVRRAFLEDPPMWAGDGPPQNPGRENPRESLRQMVEAGEAGRDAVIARGKAHSPSWAEEEFGPWADAKLHVSRNFLDALRAPFGGEWRELLAAVQRPLLLITSDTDKGSIVSPEVSEQAKQILPSLQVVRLEGAGHNIRREEYDRFIACVCQFVAAN